MGKVKHQYASGCVVSEMGELRPKIIFSGRPTNSKTDKVVESITLFVEEDRRVRLRDIIMKTCLYNFDPHKPNFFVVKLGFTGVYVIFLIFAQKIDCGYSLEPPRRGGSNEYSQSMFLAEI